MAGRGIVIKIEGDGESARRALEMVQQHLHETGETAKHEASEISEAMERVKRSLEYVGIYAGIREAQEAFKEAIAGSLEFGEAIEKAGKKTGLAAGTLSTLHYAAAVTGSDFDGMTSAVAKMDKTIGAATEGDKKATAYLQSLGLNAKDLAGRTDGAEIAFKRFAERLSATEAPVRRVELATGLLGKAGAAQIPMLLELGENWDKMTQAAKDAGVYLDEEQARQFAEANQRLKDLGERAKGAGISFTEGLTPALKSFFGELSSGAGQMNIFNNLGKSLGEELEKETADFYELAAGAHYAAYGLDKFAGMNKEAVKDLAEAHDYLARAQAMRDKVAGVYSMDHPADDPGYGGVTETGGKKPGFEGSGDLTKEKQHSDNAFITARTALVDQLAKAEADAQKNADDDALVILEARHKAVMVSDAEFYSQRLNLQQDKLNQEHAALASKETALLTQLGKQRGDHTLKRQNGGPSVEELNTTRELSANLEQLNANRAKSLALQQAYDAEVSGGKAAAELANLKAAADLEKAKGVGIAAQLALKAKEGDLAVAAAQRQGQSADALAQVRALNDVERAKISLGEVEDQIAASRAANKDRVGVLSDEMEKDPRLKKQNTAEINALNQAEAEQLQVLIDKYAGLARAIGDPKLVEQARALQADVDKLGTPDKRGDAHFAKQFGEEFSSMADRIADSTLRGKQSFHSMAVSIGQDLAELAIKLATQKWLTPFLSGLGGSGAGGGGLREARASRSRAGSTACRASRPAATPPGPASSAGRARSCSCPRRPARCCRRPR